MVYPKVERKVDADRLSEEQIKNISEQLGQKLADIINKAADEARVLTKIYGIDIKIAYHLEPLSKEKA